MTQPRRLDSRVSTRAVAGTMSVVLHVGLLLLILVSGGKRDGVADDDTPLTQLVFIESDSAARHEAPELTAWNPADPTHALGQQRNFLEVEPPPLSPIEFDEPPQVAEVVPPIEIDAPQPFAEQIPPLEIEAPGESALTAVVQPVASFVMPQAQASALVQHVERLAEELVKNLRSRTAWEQDGMQYDAELVLAPATDGIQPDRVIAQINAEDQGRRLKTRIMLKRLPFSHFAQLIDRWDPMVQMHDDEIVGRMHVNSRFNLLYDAQAMPTFLGKVTTAAGGFNVQSQGRKRQPEMFREGIETRAGRIPLTEQMRAVERAKGDEGVRVHELAYDTAIAFFPDGGYVARDRRSGSPLFSERPTDRSVYFVAARGVKVYVQGVVCGRFLVYSPQRIVVEGDLVYAHDPRKDPDSGDYLGLVSDRDIMVAPPRVTGPGDLRIHAALFARRHVIVTSFDYPENATLEIFGSLAAGTLTASEPRYATKIEYDWRFERLRPPGFPSTDRFAAEGWDGRWTEVAERAESATF